MWISLSLLALLAGLLALRCVIRLCLFHTIGFVARVRTFAKPGLVARVRTIAEPGFVARIRTNAALITRVSITNIIEVARCFSNSASPALDQLWARTEVRIRKFVKAKILQAVRTTGSEILTDRVSGIHGSLLPHTPCFSEIA